MTLASKGARRIVVDEVEYRWTISPDDEPGVAMVAEHAVMPAQRLVHWFDHGVVITPRIVRESILRAIRSGWVPTRSGPDFVRRA